MEKILIDKNKQLFPGDVIETHFVTTGMTWPTAAQIALIEWRLEKRKDFRILSHSLPVGNRVIFEIRITKPPDAEIPQVYAAGFAITAGIIGAAILGAGVLAWLTLDKIYQIIETPAAKTAIISSSLFLPAVAVIAIFIMLRK